MNSYWMSCMELSDAWNSYWGVRLSSTKDVFDYVHGEQQTNRKEDNQRNQEVRNETTNATCKIQGVPVW